MHAPSSSQTQPNVQRLNTSLSVVTPSLATTPHLQRIVSNNQGQQLRRRTPFPIINQQEKGVFERIMDSLVGDGPNDRFAMICKECYGHNGWYSFFICKFMYFMNIYI